MYTCSVLSSFRFSFQTLYTYFTNLCYMFRPSHLSCLDYCNIFLFLNKPKIICVISTNYEILFGEKKIKYEMGGACGTYGGEERCTLGLQGRSRIKRQLGSPRRRWEDNIEMRL
jgi:hypothetical protein